MLARIPAGMLQCFYRGIQERCKMVTGKTEGFEKMKQEQIEKEIDARLEEPDNDWDGIFNSGYSRGFRDGAQWRINSVWHDRAEKADTSKELILMYSNGSVRVTLLNPNLTFDGFLSVDMFIKWAYVSDILPERKEETK